MTVKSRVKRVEAVVGGSDYIGFQELLVATLHDDPAVRREARRKMKGRLVEPSLEKLLVEIALMPPREAVTVSTH